MCRCSAAASIDGAAIDPHAREDDDLAEACPSTGRAITDLRVLAAAEFKDDRHSVSPRMARASEDRGRHIAWSALRRGKVNELLTDPPCPTTHSVDRSIAKKMPAGPVLDLDDPEIRIELPAAARDSWSASAALTAPDSKHTDPAPLGVASAQPRRRRSIERDRSVEPVDADEDGAGAPRRRAAR